MKRRTSNPVRQEGVTVDEAMFMLGEDRTFVLALILKGFLESYVVAGNLMITKPSITERLLEVLRRRE